MALSKANTLIEFNLLNNFFRFDFTIFYEYSLSPKEKNAFPDNYQDYLDLNRVRNLCKFALVSN